jgi:hypothetical protein
LFGPKFSAKTSSRSETSEIPAASNGFGWFHETMIVPLEKSFLLSALSLHGRTHPPRTAPIARRIESRLDRRREAHPAVELEAWAYASCVPQEPGYPVLAIFEAGTPQ